MRLTSDKRIAARDRRKAAIHEAGHFVMGEHLGFTMEWACIERTFSDNPSGEKLWVGRTRRVNGGSKQAVRLYAVAGSVAESIWDGSDDFFEEEFYDKDALSATDWAGAGCKPGNPTKVFLSAIEQAYTLFERSGPLWPRVLAKSRELIVDSRDHISPEELREQQGLRLSADVPVRYAGSAGE
ncbi:hypothetical protein [Pseudorhodoplanes sp.]|uniref:hypothetical protein n=1 Tax=Pseudorhodoplanes sp. TaxID=1934341 RepID=UPI003D0A9895